MHAHTHTHTHTKHTHTVGKKHTFEINLKKMPAGRLPVCSHSWFINFQGVKLKWMVYLIKE